MLTGSNLARISYAVFALGVLLALLKLGVISGTKPLSLRIVPATPIAKAAEPAAAEGRAPEGEAMDQPDVDGPAPEPVERLLTITSRVANLPDKEDRTGSEEKSGAEAPAFYRPSSGETRDRDGVPVCGNLGDFPKSSRVVFPLPGDYFYSYEDTWGAARPQGGHEGADLMSPTGTPEFAITDGAIVPVKGANGNGWNTLGGYTVMLEAAYDAGPIKKGDLFYYAHMDKESALSIGTKVRAGQQIGVVGDTGEGREGARGKFPPHLHFGWYDTGSAGSRANLKSGAMNPYPLLLWLEENGGALSGGTDTAYCEAPQGPVPESSGTSPDLDTGDDNDARPSPVIGESRKSQNSPKREPGRENEPDEENRPSEKDERADAVGGETSASPAAELKKGDGVRDGGDGTSAPAADQASPLSTGDGPSRVKIKTPMPGPASPDQTLRPSYSSALVHILGSAGKDDRKRHTNGAPDEKKRKKQKNSSNPSERKEPEKNRDGAKTRSTPARPRPIPDEKVADRAPTSKKNPVTRSEKTGPEGQTCRKTNPSRVEMERDQPPRSTPSKGSYACILPDG